MFNFDMVGEGDKSGIGYSDSSRSSRSSSRAPTSWSELSPGLPDQGGGVRGSDTPPSTRRGFRSFLPLQRTAPLLSPDR